MDPQFLAGVPVGLPSFLLNETMKMASEKGGPFDLWGFEI